MPTPNVNALLNKLAEALGALKLRWYVFGAQAVIAAGASRSTADIDITVDVVDVKPLLRALSKAGFKLRDDVDDLESVIETLRVLPLSHRASGFQLDVVLAGPGLEELMLERVIRRRVGRRLIPFVETNDLVVLKILAGRPKDLEDVCALLRLELADLKHDVIRLRLSELEKLIDDSTLVDCFERQVDRSGA